MYNGKKEEVRETLERVMREKGYLKRPFTLKTEIGDFTSYMDENSPLLAQKNQPQEETETNQYNSGQQLQMPAGTQQYITVPKRQEPTTWDKLKDWAESTGEAIQAGAVGYTSGATLGNFDEAMGAATAAVTLNPNNYAMGRDAVRQMQQDLQRRHPYIYGGAEFVGAMTTPIHLFKETSFANKAKNAFTDTVNASAGYAENWDDFGTNLAVNGIANNMGLEFDKIPFMRAAGKPIVQFGKKFIKQGINSFADKMKNTYYDDGYENEEYY